MRALIAMAAALWLGACAAQPHGSVQADMAAQIRGEQRIVNAHPPVFNSLERTPSPKPDEARATVAAGNGVPAFNAQAICRQEESLEIDQNVDRCLSVERRARDQLARKWTELSSAERAHCVRYTTAGGGGTYTVLLTCLETERDVKNLHMKNRFVAHQ